MIIAIHLISYGGTNDSSVILVDYNKLSQKLCSKILKNNSQISCYASDDESWNDYTGEMKELLAAEVHPPQLVEKILTVFFTDNYD